MSQAATIVAIIAGSFAVLGVVVGVVVFVKGAYGAARLQAVREDNTDLRAALADSDREGKIKDAKIDALAMRVEQLESEGTTLREMALQHANVQQAIEEIQKHSEESHDMWMKIMKRLDQALEKTP